MICCGTSNRLSHSKLFHAQLLDALYNNLLLFFVEQQSEPQQFGAAVKLDFCLNRDLLA